MSNAFACAVRLLTRREHGAYELTNKLLKKGYPENEAQDAVLECQRLDLQSDERFVDNICRARIRHGYGPLRIRRELQDLQIDAELITNTLRQEQDNWLSYALEVWKKKYKEQGELSYSAMQKQKQFLLYRGFSTDTIAMLFKDIIANVET